VSARSDRWLSFMIGFTIALSVFVFGILKVWW